jgi:hypothetical protein
VRMVVPDPEPPGILCVRVVKVEHGYSGIFGHLDGSKKHIAHIWRVLLAERGPAHKISQEVAVRNDSNSFFLLFG